MFWRTFEKPKETFSDMKNLLCNGMVPWMSKVLYGTINGNKEHLFFRVYSEKRSQGHALV